MGTLLVKNIHTLVTMDEGRREVRNASMLVRDAAIEQIGITGSIVDSADEVLDLKGR
jgi:8-oxoguanine deaminase